MCMYIMSRLHDRTYFDVSFIFFCYFQSDKKHISASLIDSIICTDPSTHLHSQHQTKNKINFFFLFLPFLISCSPHSAVIHPIDYQQSGPLQPQLTLLAFRTWDNQTVLAPRCPHIHIVPRWRRGIKLDPCRGLIAHELLLYQRPLSYCMLLKKGHRLFGSWGCAPQE